MYSIYIYTFWAVSANALSDQELPLPQYPPQKVSRSTTNLHHLAWSWHLLPHRAFRVEVADSIPEPHLHRCTSRYILYN